MTDTNEDLMAKIERLQAENAELKSKYDAPLSCKVSQKGGVSVYGLGRFPVTLYTTQWEKLLTSAPKVAAFIVGHKDELKFKDQDTHEVAIKSLQTIAGDSE